MTSQSTSPSPLGLWGSRCKEWHGRHEAGDLSISGCPVGAFPSVFRAKTSTVGVAGGGT